MLELVTVQTGKFVQNINEKRKETHYSKKQFIKPFGQLDVVNVSVKNMCTDFVTSRRIRKKKCVSQNLQKRLRYWWVNCFHLAHEGASVVDIREALEQIWRFKDPGAEQGITLTIPKVLIEIIPFNSSTREKRFCKNYSQF